MTASATPRSLAVMAAQQLSLASGPEQFGQILEDLARGLTGMEQARFYSYAEPPGILARRSLGATEGPRVVALDNSSQEGWCALHREALVHQEGGSEPPEAPPPAAGALSSVAVPAIYLGALTGVLVLESPREASPSRFLEALCELAEAAAVIYHLLEQVHLHASCVAEAQELLVQATDRGSGHTGRVARLASELALLLDLSARSRQLLWQAAQYHDVGKLVLAGREPAEVERLHPVAGGDFLRASGLWREAAPAVEAHHERYDGSGFPRGRQGDQVPLEGWVLALAEDVEEHRQSRPDLDYPGWLEAFLSERGGGHHPAVLDALGGLADSGRLARLVAGEGALP
ncbi:MAG TPA: HD domain-containing phosphohydrolase [Candidatus Nitrosotenuis sp.]|jgi:putative nucleotidyltransferase with HDIG domain|nr:HD domain-containing phosphohydrolase [Candidatus Nitrosotenuis sp.]